MAGDDVMLNSDRSVGLIQYGDRWYFVEELELFAHDLQYEALLARQAGDHGKAVRLYRDLIPVLIKLDELEVYGTLGWLQVQVAKRTVEQLEAAAA